MLTQPFNLLGKHVLSLLILFKILTKKVDLFLVVSLNRLESLVHFITILFNIADSQLQMLILSKDLLLNVSQLVYLKVRLGDMLMK